MGTRVYIGRLSSYARERDIERFFKGYGRLKDIMLKNGYGFIEFEDYRDADDAVYELNGKDLCGERVSLEHARGPSARGRGGYGYGFRSRGRPSWFDKVIVEHARGAPRGDDYGRHDSYNSRRFNSFPRRRGGGGGGRDKYGPPTRTENRLVVENLSSRVSWQKTVWDAYKSYTSKQSGENSWFVTKCPRWDALPGQTNLFSDVMTDVPISLSFEDLKDYMRQAGEVTYADAHKQHKNEGVVEFATYSDMKSALEKLDNTEINGRKIRLVEDRPRIVAEADLDQEVEVDPDLDIQDQGVDLEVAGVEVEVRVGVEARVEAEAGANQKVQQEKGQGQNHQQLMVMQRRTKMINCLDSYPVNKNR
ncbi:hypothetical protein KUTeg_013056 [Tegillarca granosa]|uniref:RRM domain-containing protein n=1 Tax=Tegillarca granosa TaxID=220873 RepID=A0ABQ9ESL0_TEGGR|nr:hypothetical protein KUTeg_013056 [Tegillarca granosa]